MNVYFSGDTTEPHRGQYTKQFCKTQYDFRNHNTNSENAILIPKPQVDKTQNI